ncbi:MULTISPECIES: energy transducer TonB [Pseudomonas]|uniref:Protein TonB n=1 Tax=Pseudomonas palleroniana TaxID=191390 RepID=A0A1H5K7U1_9PSED|nr:energy transducer TonB [Pseudomonas palleroniana]KAB0564962.1 energy transducer TonB [Pseudomonas palleroniana]KWU49578.1 energy transducer TonB [Pseudomonas palleroniana]PTC30510.1 energy transducer TonB [Pseudomonas palleroniana]SEE60108.1 outer membrane transport energization protein TonB [Pseudomonas palleroniana]
MGNVQTAASAHEAQWRQGPGGELVDLGRPHRAPLGQLRLQKTPKRFSSRREGFVLGLLVLALHGALIYWVSQKPTPVLPIVPPEIPPMTIEFSQPAPPVVEPPPPVPPPPPPPVVEPPPPVVDELAAKPAPPKPIPKPVPKPQPKPKPKPEPAPKAVEQPPAPPVPAPPAPAAPVAAPAPVTPASANAAYLKNPAPEYPSLAQRRGWEGTVLLRVHVLASGKPGEIQVQKSSGRQQLDDAALAAVKRWSFVPAKQGDVAQDGWVSVPIDFKIH